MPYVINPLFQLTSGTEPISEDVQELILFYLGLGTCIFLPFACLAATSHLKKKLKNIIDYLRWPNLAPNRRGAVNTIQLHAVASRR